jgi:hypothetical protein
MKYVKILGFAAVAAAALTAFTASAWATRITVPQRALPRHRNFTR